MRIGILTLPFNNNYGGYLQAYALQTVLEEAGHSVEIINRRHPKETVWRKLMRVASSIKHLRRYHYDINAHKGALMHSFVQSKMNLSEPLYTSEALHNYCLTKDFDCYIAGSDQLWRPEYVPNVEDYFFDYLPSKTKRIAYAASFGVANPVYTEEQKANCGRAIKKINRVGLRESSGIEVIKHFGWEAYNATIVLDPTMLLSVEHYKSLVKDYHPKKDFHHKILAYVLDKNEQISEIKSSCAHYYRKQCEEIIDSDKWENEGYVLPAIEEWLCAFRDADFIITDSFHGTVFSILFHKPFVVIINKGRGRDRFDTLLGHFGLKNRMTETKNSIDNILNGDIVWDKVDAMLQKHRENSLHFLLDKI